MSKAKYIVGRFKKNRIVSCIVFSEFINHCDMADNFSSITGAGFCFIKNGVYQPDVEVYGESVSLGVKSRKEDVDFVKKALGL